MNSSTSALHATRCCTCLEKLRLLLEHTRHFLRESHTARRPPSLCSSTSLAAQFLRAPSLAGRSVRVGEEQRDSRAWIACARAFSSRADLSRQIHCRSSPLRPNHVRTLRPLRLSGTTRRTGEGSADQGRSAATAGCVHAFASCVCLRIADLSRSAACAALAQAQELINKLNEKWCAVFRRMKVGRKGRRGG